MRWGDKIRTKEIIEDKMGKHSREYRELMISIGVNKTKLRQELRRKNHKTEEFLTNNYTTKTKHLEELNITRTNVSIGVLLYSVMTVNLNQTLLWSQLLCA